MERKFLITSIFITLGSVAFLSGYLLMPQTDQQLTTDDLQLNQTGSLVDRFSNKVGIGSAEDKIPNTLPLSSRKFISFVQPFSDSKKVVAVTVNGEVVEIDLANLLEKVIYSGQTTIDEAVLSPNGNSIVYSFYPHTYELSVGVYDTTNNKRRVYRNLKTGELTEIEGDLKSAVFSPQGDKSAYLLNNGEEGELLIAKDGKVIKRVLKTRLDVATVSWPRDDFMSIVSYDKDGYGDLFVLKEGDVLNKILSYQYNLNVRWSPSGEKIIFSGKDDTGHTQLFYKDIKNSGAITVLDISTDASKCIWTDEENVICGITNKTQIKDEFYKISITDGSKTLVATPSINLLIRELSLNRSGDALFILNDIDGKLYVLKIK